MISSKENSPIFVTGVERSGSTLIAKILQLCGGYTGTTNVMCENIAIKALGELYYKQIVPVDKNTVIGQYPLPDTKERIPLPTWHKQVLDCLRKYDGKQPWVYKSAKLVQLWPIWFSAFPNARWIIVRRRTGDIVYSCTKTAHMIAFKNEVNQKLIGASNEKEAWLFWVREHEKRFVEMIEAGVNCKVVWPERMADGDYQQIYEMLEWVGLPWSDKIITTIQPLLWKGRILRKGGEK